MSDDNAKISVIATRLPFTDRRALSEAWFSALHLASDGPVSPKALDRRGALQDDATTAVRKSGRSEAGAPVTAPQRPLAGRFADATGRALPADMLLRAGRGRALREQAAFARARSYDGFRTSLTFGVEGERVALVLRREGATLHVVAVCRAEVADIVRRALASADLQLRARGESIRASVSTLPSGDAA
jgi:hypothetical protein